MMGPHTHCKNPQEDGETVFRTSRYYAIGNDEQRPEYLVWEANLDSSFKAFEELCKQIFVLSEMGEAFLGSSAGVGKRCFRNSNANENDFSFRKPEEFQMK